MLYAIFVLFEDRCFLYATFLKFVFIEAPPPQCLQETNRFASIEDASRFSALCDLPETFIKKKFRKFFFFNFLFSKRFPVQKDGFSAVSSWGIIVFETFFAYPFGYFLAL